MVTATEFKALDTLDRRRFARAHRRLRGGTTEEAHRVIRVVGVADDVVTEAGGPPRIPIGPQILDSRKIESDDLDTVPDWSKSCDTCGEKPIVPLTGMCGPCTFGEAETIGGNW